MSAYFQVIICGSIFVLSQFSWSIQGDTLQTITPTWECESNFFSAACIFLLFPLDLANSELTCVFNLVTTLLSLTLALSSSRAQQSPYHMVVLS